MHRKRHMRSRAALALLLALLAIFPGCIVAQFFIGYPLYHAAKPFQRAHADALGRKRAEQWTDSSILDGEGGYVYILEHQPCSLWHHLKRYDVRSGEWHVFEDLDIQYGALDIASDLLACTLPYDDVNRLRSTGVFALPDCRPLMTLPDSFAAVAVDPSGKFLAVLDKGDREPVPYPAGRRKYYRVDIKCRLEIFAIPSGEEVFEYPECVRSHGIAWSPDSSAIAFTSFHDKDLFKQNPDEMGRYISDYRPWSPPPVIHICDLATGTTTEHVSGMYPQWSPDSARLLFEDADSNVSMYELETGHVTTLFPTCDFLPGYYKKFQWSPTGKNVAMTFKRGRGASDSDLAVVNVLQPERRFLLASEWCSLCDWTK